MKQFLIVLLVMGFASAALAQGLDGRGTGLCQSPLQVTVA